MAEGDISFDGILYPRHLTAFRTNGLRPNRALLVALPQDNPPMLNGTLEFGFNGQFLQWQNALCDSALMRVGNNGQLVYWTILDERWRAWKSFIVGAYNVRLPDGTIDTDTEKTLAELATLLFTEMGFTADVSAITSPEKPEVVWEHDRCVPELEELLDRRGYVASYQNDGTFKVYVIGSGATLPNDDDVVSYSSSINPPERPLTLRVRGAKTRVQSKLHMIPVGLDIDGKIKKVKDLSYNPGGVGAVDGWDKRDLETFAYVIGDKERALAQMSVGKWYQVEFQANDDHNISASGTDYSPGEITIDSAFQYLPLSEELVATSLDVFGKKRHDMAFVEGEFYLDDDNPPKADNSEPFSRIDRRDWSLDGELGIVKFFAPARMKTDAGWWTFADVYLTCSYSVHDNTSHVKDRFIRDRDMGGTGVDQVNIEELERTLECEYASDNVTISSIIDSEATVIVAADNVLDNVAASYGTAQGNTITYRGIKNYSTDGINLQVVWHCNSPNGHPPFNTYVSQNCEAHPLAPRAGDRRQKRQNERSNLWNTGRGRRFRNQQKGGRRRR